MKGTSRFALTALTTLAAFLSLTSENRAQEVVSSYVTFYGFDDNDDGDPTHLGTDVISSAVVHSRASEDLGTYERPGTLATDESFLTPGTMVYVPALKRYYVMEDTCVECSEDWDIRSIGFNARFGSKRSVRVQPANGEFIQAIPVCEPYRWRCSTQLL